ncbi:MAG: hypothetical protein ABIR46_03120 [Candidatus Saccharimonadales bacterium]
MKEHRQARIIIWSLAALSAVLLILLGLAVYTQSVSDSKVPTSVALPTPTKLPREITKAATNDEEYLVLTYSDGSTQVVGYVQGAPGQDGIVSDTQVLQAVFRYCANGRCDPLAPTPEQVAIAVAINCDGSCQGGDGQNAVITPEQLQEAVVSFCADGRCKGEAGATGVAGETPEFRCFLNESETPSRTYLQYKMPSQTEWINLIKQPVGSTCE